MAILRWSLYDAFKHEKCLKWKRALKRKPQNQYHSADRAKQNKTHFLTGMPQQAAAEAINFVFNLRSTLELFVFIKPFCSFAHGKCNDGWTCGSDQLKRYLLLTTTITSSDPNEAIYIVNSSNSHCFCMSRDEFRNIKYATFADVLALTRFFARHFRKEKFDVKYLARPIADVIKLLFVETYLSLQLSRVSGVAVETRAKCP